MTQQEKESLIRTELIAIGENPDREGLLETPRRVVKSWDEIYKGYDLNQKPDITVFENGNDGLKISEMIHDKGYFFSQCEHHKLPFFGRYHFAYIPNKKVLGLSKVARIVDYFSSKLQVQERLTKEILDEIEKQVEPLGIALMLEGRHLCKEMRGVKQVNSAMVTSDLRGVFFSKSEVRNEFLLTN